MSNNGYSYYLGYFANGMHLINIYDELLNINATHPLEKLCDFITRFESEEELNSYLIGMGYIDEPKQLIIIEKRGDNFKELPGPLVYKPHKDLLTKKGLEKGSNKFTKHPDFYFWALNYLNSLKLLPFTTIPELSNYTKILSGELAYVKKVLRGPKYGYKGRLKDMTKTMKEVFNGAIFDKYLGNDDVSFRRIYDIASLLLRYVSDTVKYDEIINNSEFSMEDERIINILKKRYNDENYSEFIITFGSLIYNVYYERFKDYLMPKEEEYIEDNTRDIIPSDGEIRLF